MWLSGAGLVLGLFVLPGCGHGSLPRPSYAPAVVADYVQVPFSPRPPPVEIVPARPRVTGRVVWADGGWEWTGERYRWDAGSWVVVPEGTRRVRWVLVRREVDGQLFFAPSSWRDASGKAAKAPRSLARAQTRMGGSASGLDEVGGGGGGGAGPGEPPPPPPRSGASGAGSPPVLDE